MRRAAAAARRPPGRSEAPAHRRTSSSGTRTSARSTAGGFGPTEQAPGQPTHVQRVQPVAEQRDGRRRHHNRGDGRERHHRDAGVGERLQEVHRKQHHRRPSTARPSSPRTARSGRQSAIVRDQRLVAVRTVGQLVAEPADDQQGVVDRPAPNPSRRCRFSAKIDTSVTKVMTRSTAIDPKIAQHRRPPSAARPPAGRRTPTPAPGSSAESRWTSISSRSFSVWSYDLRVGHRVTARTHVTPSRSCTNLSD